jgi:Skp family chaperone for outer membrane proteins
MHRSLPVLVLLGLGVMFVGCGMPTGMPGRAEATSSTKGGLAVIDLDIVAKTIGRTDEMNEAIRLRENALNQQLLKIQTSFRDQLEAKQKEFGEQPTDDQKGELARMQNEANNRLVNAKRTAEVNREQYRQELISQFRQEVRPVAQEVALTKGLGVVIPKNEGFLLSVDPGVDITNEVSEKLQMAKVGPKPQASDAEVSSGPTVENTRTVSQSEVIPE